MKIIIFLLFFYQTAMFACSIFDFKNKKNEVLIARNFDWSKNDIQINFFPSSTKNYGVVLLSLENPNMPYEGINDRGLSVVISAVPNAQTPLNLFKPIRKSLEMVKIILQKTDNISQAIKEFNKKSVVFGHFLGYPLIHFKITQKDGKSAIVEFVNNQMVVIEGEKAKIMTNHYISTPSIQSDNKTSFKRFNIIRKNRVNSVQEAFELLQKVKQDNTIYSVVYNLTKQQIYFKYKNDIVKFELKDELYKSNKPFFYKMKNLKNRQKLPIKSNSNIQIRTHFGYGNGGNRHYGLRILLNSSDKQSYGLEITKFTKKSDFKAIGIVLEQRLWGWFNMSIGTIGYFDYGAEKQNLIGLVSNIGYEPDNHIPFKPFLTYRNDIIFLKNKTKTLHSFSIGFKFEF